MTPRRTSDSASTPRVWVFVAVLVALVALLTGCAKAVRAHTTVQYLTWTVTTTALVIVTYALCRTLTRKEH